MIEQYPGEARAWKRNLIWGCIALGLGCAGLGYIAGILASR